MPSDYEDITNYNERQLGLDTASRKTQISMYSDSTHFIYEILQNADDYRASEITFKLSQDKLLVEHNGEPFEEENVKAITYFGQSTSRDDLVKTGRFGVGFKSVFAFTATPIVVSGDEHFQIHGLYRINEYPYPVDLPKNRTRIVLPFNHDSEQPDYVEDLMLKKEAYDKIATRLTSLNMNTLLFTQNIREIRWEIDDRSGHYLREDKIEGPARWTTIITEGDESGKYLVFSKIPQWKKKEHKAVEIAFAMGGKNQPTPVDDFLYVLFATTQETHLQFIINGPFRTNPSRETIAEDDSFNLHLIKEMSALIGDALQHIKKLDLLTPSFLSVLPNANDSLRDFYNPLRKATFEAFLDHELVPTDEDGYASSNRVLQGPAPIREVIAKSELAFFTEQDDICWAKGVSPNSRPAQFLDSLDIQQWGWKELGNTLYAKFGVYIEKEEDKIWLEKRSDSWLQKLYCLIADALKKDDIPSYRLMDDNIIRVVIDRIQNHIKGSDAYFPKRSYKDLPQIKPSILQGKTQQATQKIEDSLVALGVSKIGDEERIDKLLQTSYSYGSESVDTKQHLHNMITFIKWWKKERDASKFVHYSIFRSEGNGGMHKPEDCFIDSPLRKSELNQIYSVDVPSVNKKVKIWNGYKKLVKDEFCEFAVACGVADKLQIKKRYCRRHPQWDEMKRGGTKETKSQIDEDYYIPSLNRLLKLKDVKINRLIWNTLRNANPSVFTASYRPNQQYATLTRKSTLIMELSDTAWIPDEKGHFLKPSDIIKTQLHQDLKYDNRNGWLDEIRFGENAKKEDEEYKNRTEMASSLGIPADVAEYFSGLSELSDDERKKEIKEFESFFKKKETAKKHAQRMQQEDIPYHEALTGAFSASGRSNTNENGVRGGSARNPSRRRTQVSEDIAGAIENEGRSGSRFSYSLRKKWKGKNDNGRVELAEWYNGQCQICDQTFTQRSGEPYFEGLYLVPHTTAEWLDRVGNILCLCPWHSAKFQYGPKELDKDIIEQVKQLSIQAEGGDGQPAIEMRLCGEKIRIKFAEKHLIDLQEMIKITEEPSSKSLAV
jgi:hypothetical protein